MKNHLGKGISLRLMRVVRFTWLLRAAVGTAGVLLSAPVSANTYNVDLASDLQSALIDTGLGVNGVAGGVVTSFFSFQAGDTIDFGAVTLAASIGHDQYGDYFLELGVLDVSNTPYSSGPIPTPGGAKFMDACNQFLNSNCYVSVEAAFATYVPEPQSLIFTIPNGDDGIQLAFTDPYTYSPPTPIPATLPLFATGLGAMGLLGWRRKRKLTAVIDAA
jgi:hypothetical protein